MKDMPKPIRFVYVVSIVFVALSIVVPIGPLMAGGTTQMSVSVLVFTLSA